MKFPTTISVNMGAVGALAPTIFESVDAGTHGFLQILFQFHQFS